MTDKSTRAMAAGARQAGSSYDRNDCVEFIGRTDHGSRVFYGRRRLIDEKVKLLKLAADDRTTLIDLPTRFGNGPIHKSELLKTIAEAMSSHPLVSGGYIEELMRDEGWIGWFRLSTHSESRSCWFNNSLTADQEIFDTCCQNFMQQLFTMFKSACYNLTSSLERAFFNFLLSGDFVSLYETKLPVSLRDNRECAIYLVMTLKTIFET